MSAQRSPPPARVLVVDDNPRYGEWLRHHLDVLCPQASVSMLNLEEFQRWFVPRMHDFAQVSDYQP